jgi:hypothetical protein
MNIANKVKDAVEDYGTYGLQFLAGLAGLTAGQLIVMLTPKTNKALIDKLLAGGISETLAIALIAKFGKDQLWRAGAFGLGMSGMANQVYNFTLGSTSKIGMKINQATNLPGASLSGFALGNAPDQLLSGFGNVAQSERQVPSLLS